MTTATCYTLTDIQERTGIVKELLRYVVDQKLLPGLRRSSAAGSRGRGIPRSFVADEALAIACAAQLLDTGLRRQAVLDSMIYLCRHRPGSGPNIMTPIQTACVDAQIAYLEIGDRSNIRLRAATKRMRTS